MSNKIELSHESREQVEQILKKIATQNNIESVDKVDIVLTKEAGVVTFKMAAGDITKNLIDTAVNNTDAWKDFIPYVPGVGAGVSALNAGKNLVNKAINSDIGQSAIQGIKDYFSPSSSVPSATVTEGLEQGMPDVSIEDAEALGWDIIQDTEGNYLYSKDGMNYSIDSSALLKELEQQRTPQQNATQQQTPIAPQTPTASANAGQPAEPESDVSPKSGESPALEPGTIGPAAGQGQRMLQPGQVTAEDPQNPGTLFTTDKETALANGYTIKAEG